MSKVVSVENFAGHRSKLEMEVRLLVEEILKSGTKPKPDDRTKTEKQTATAFNRMKKLHPALSESDSRSLNQLIWATFKQIEMKDALDDMDLKDELYDKVFNRMDKLEKQIDKLEDKLNIALKYRLGQAQSIAKVINEALKAAQLENDETNDADDKLANIIVGSVE